MSNVRAERALLEPLHARCLAAAEVIIVTDAGLSSTVVYPCRAPGLVVDRAHSHRGMSLARWRSLGGSPCVVRKSYRQGVPMEQLLAHAQLPPFPATSCCIGSASDGRKRYGRAGHGSTPKARREARASAKEPWLLAHSPRLRSYRPEQIVAMYGQRMQIEENFRDSKSPELGMGLRTQPIALAIAACMRCS